MQHSELIYTVQEQQSISIAKAGIVCRSVQCSCYKKNSCPYMKSYWAYCLPYYDVIHKCRIHCLFHYRLPCILVYKRTILGWILTLKLRVSTYAWVMPHSHTLPAKSAWHGPFY